MIKSCSCACFMRKLYFCSFRRNILRLAVLIACAYLLYNEFLIYLISPYSWPKMKCGEIDKLHSVLLVADAQILGEKSELSIARWDNDRYLKQSFAAALRHVQPELIIFLGDLMDEGSIATEEEYQRYFLRFRDIFQLDFISSNKTVFIPGDNDIGGEDELVTPKKVIRFQKFFPSPTVFYLGDIQFVQVDKMQRIVPSVPPLLQNDTHTRVVVSHMPLLAMPSAFSAEVLQKLRPHLILSAHDHKSVHFSADIDRGERMLIEPLVNNPFAKHTESSWRFQHSNHIANEVVVPTCSYRMGVPDMGFGVALFDRWGSAWCYHVLWLPPRFIALYLYLVVVVVLLATLVLWNCCLAPCRSKRRLSPQFHKL